MKWMGRARGAGALVAVGAALLASGCGKKDGAGTEPSATSSTSGAAQHSAASASHSSAAAPHPSANAATATTAAPVRKMTQAQAVEHLEAAITEYKKGATRKCVTVANEWAIAYGGLSQVAAEEREATYDAARCGEILENWTFTRLTGQVLAKLDPSSEKYAFVPRALLGLKEDKAAMTALEAIDKKLPDQPEVLFTAALVSLNDKKWPELVKIADATSKAVDKSTDPDVKNFAWRVKVLREAADWYLGHVPDADADIAAAAKAGAPAAYVDEMKRELVPMKMNKIGVDITNPIHLFLGTYHLLGNAQGLGNFIGVSLVNVSGKDRILKVEIEVPGITEKLTKNETLLTGKTETLYLTPALKADFKPASQTAERNAQISIKVTTADGKSIFDDSRAVTVYPRDQFPRSELGTNTIAAWVTPQSPAMEDFMTAAKKRMKGGVLEGNLGATMPQVKAIYDELKARGMTYVLQSDLGYGTPQHVRLPADAIKSTNALCLDGAVVFATLMEKIGLRPIVIFVPGHAFAGWHAEKADNAPDGTVYWVETTMVGSAPFENAVQTAASEYKKYTDQHAAELVDIAAMRTRKITPQPWE